MTSLSGVCFGMQNMQTFVSACGHLVRVLCLHLFKERGRQDAGQTAVAAQSAQASEAWVKGQGACSLVEPHSVAPLSYNEREFTLK